MRREVMKKKWIILSILIVTIFILFVTSCQKSVKEEVNLSPDQTVSSAVGKDSAKGQTITTNNDDVIAYYTAKHREEMEIEFTKKGLDITKGDVKKYIGKEAKRYEMVLRKKWETAPEGVKDYMRNVVRYDRMITKNIGFDRLKKLYCEGKITEKEIIEKYKAEAKKIGFFSYISKLFQSNNVSNSKSLKRVGKNIRKTTSALHQTELSVLRRGDVMVCLSSGSSSSSSSSSSDFGHSAIWKGDSYPSDLHSHVAMSAWNDPWTYPYEVAPHELYNEVGYDHRQFWSGRLVSTDGVIHGMRVGRRGWFGSWTDTSNTEAANGERYAEAQRGKPYPEPVESVSWTKLNTGTFYCSSLVWRSWYEQGIDLDPKWWPLNQFYVTPADIYGDDNTIDKFTYSGLKY